MTKILIVYHSQTGKTRQMADTFAEWVDKKLLFA